MPPPDRSRRIAGAAVLGVALLLGLAVVGSVGGGSWQMEPRFNLFPNRSLVTVPTTTVPGGPPDTTAEWDFRNLDRLWQIMGIASLVIAVLLVGWLMWLTLIYVKRNRRRRLGLSGDAGGLNLAEVVDELPVLQKGVEAAQKYLDDIADTDDAIIAAWLALEEAAAATGVRRDRSQTPTEFTVAVLESTDADPEATQGLLDLYREARFSSHSMQPESRRAASIYLRRLAAKWAVPVRAVVTEVSE